MQSKEKAPIVDVVIPGNSVESARLIIEEAAAVLKGHAERMHAMAAPDDWQSKTAAMLTMDHVKKLAWVHKLITPSEAKSELRVVSDEKQGQLPIC